MFINDVYAQESLTKATSSDTVTLQDSDALPKAPESLGNSWTSLVPMVLIFAVFYFLLIRPQEKRRRAQQDLVSGVKKGEEVLTNSGIIGVVSAILGYGVWEWRVEIKSAINKISRGILNRQN
jgi:preprotein translocase YajC subunit